MKKNFWIRGGMFILSMILSVAPVFVVSNFFTTNTPEFMMWVTVFAVAAPLLVYRYVLQKHFDVDIRHAMFAIIVNLIIALFMFPHG